MKRMLVLAAIGAAAALPASPAAAHHVCLATGGGDVFCLPHVDPEDLQVCVTSEGEPVYCV